METSSLTTDEQRLILRTTAGDVRDHTIISLALGTGLRLAEIVGLDLGDVFAANVFLLNYPVLEFSSLPVADERLVKRL